MAEEKINEFSYDCGILNFWWGSNYGAVLTCYALQETIKSLGFIPRVINHVPEKYIQFKGGLSEYFANKYLDITERCASRRDLQKLNEQTDTFIVGSDQVWRFPYFWPWGKNVYQLNFASADKKKIAYAVSFGTDHFEGGYQETLKTGLYIKRFDAISVREQDGVDICKNTFDVKAEHVLDPVFLADASAWHPLIANATATGEGFIASYILDKSQFAQDSLAKVKQYFNGISSIDMKDGAKDMKLSIENWLYNISKCRFFITNSFHGVCFAVIFQKPFICLANRNRGFSRFSSLLSLLGLQKHCISSIEELDDIEVYTNIDYATVNKLLSVNIKSSKAWLQNALTTKRKEPDTIIETAAMLLANDDDNYEKLSAAIMRPQYQKQYYLYKLKSWFSLGKKRKKYWQKSENMRLLLQNKIDL